MKKAVFLDRDGTLIIDKIYLNDVDQIEYIPGVFSAMQSLRDAGYSFAVVTNQSGIARGIVDVSTLYQIHDRIRADFCRHGVDILGFYYAPYMTDFNHPMRKPNPGMLETGARDFNLDLSSSWMVGDRMSDVEAGHRAGCRSALVGQTENVADSPFRAPEVSGVTLFEAADLIIKTP